MDTKTKLRWLQVGTHEWKAIGDGLMGKVWREPGTEEWRYSIKGVTAWPFPWAQDEAVGKRTVETYYYGLTEPALP